MYTLTATQASRGFAALLDRVAHGESVVITRDGEPIARIEPEHATSGAKLLSLYANKEPDPDFADDLQAAHDEMRSLPDRAEDVDW